MAKAPEDKDDEHWDHLSIQMCTKRYMDAVAKHNSAAADLEFNFLKGIHDTWKFLPGTEPASGEAIKVIDAFIRWCSVTPLSERRNTHFTYRKFMNS